MVQHPLSPGFFEYYPQVDECLKESGIKEGLVLVNGQSFLVKQAVPFIVAGRYSEGTADP